MLGGIQRPAIGRAGFMLEWPTGNSRWSGELVLAGKPAVESWNVKKIYVGNLPFTATEDEVTELFGAHGDVHSVALINDRETGRPRGFGFIEMDDSAATAAISALDGHDMGGRPLRVNEAQDKPRRDGGGGGGGGGYGGGGGGGGDRNRGW
jgi:hypothetical protein